ncbi:BON domain-containing protein [Oculatella sp. LEGE 06141]|uniref:BON domain-containing protein n=1 Tax=Oculatella sp. LEGE 06141 TaxID=1828648 RepID=UPI00187EFDC1|nr:BON domain-containing protein [Oculatella sp. LEGE 06141]MBE9178409.1 BON domain-containing protein [Oculatella sp. LEGE 06141]
MSWLDRIAADPAVEGSHKGGAGMGPGLTGNYDQDLREKAGLHNPPPPPECMGVEGEYDAGGLVKRVAIALDSDPNTSTIDSISLVQQGSVIALQGQITDQKVLDQIVHIVSQVDGTRAVDTDAVAVSHPGPAQ